MLKITNQSLDMLREDAVRSPRRRMNLNVHKSLDARVQRLFNAMEPGTYVRPHRHIQDGRFELFLCIRGKGAVFVFDERGEVAETAVICPGGENIGVEIPPNTWHTIVPLEPGTIFFEVKEGPYIEVSDKDFASWAPEPSSEECGGYLKWLVSKV